MQQPKDILIQRNLEKSDEAFRFAQIAVNENALTTALNRIYYTIFYTVSALAYKNDFSTSKHAKLMGWFHKKFVHEDKVFDRETYKIYEDAFSYRQDSDYDALYKPDLEKVKELLANAKVFIEVVRKVI
jgi:uncharacterized protein (UPF0332 family)